MVRNHYRYTMAFYRDNGEALGEWPVQIDWQPAIECARLSALRQGFLSSHDFGVGASVVPVWDATGGEPQVGGFRVELDASLPAEAASEFPLLFLKPVAQSMSVALVRSGMLSVGEYFQYAVYAFPLEAQAGEPAPKFGVREAVFSLPVSARPLAAFQEASAPRGKALDGDLPVFVRQSVLDEATRQAEQTDSVETGGILIGHIHQDTETPEVFLEVTAQLSAQHTQSQATSLTFTCETWAAARDAIRLRGEGELILGWWHSHPVKAWCPECPPEKRRNCSMQSCFFSEADVNLHETVFPRAYSVALVLTHTDAGMQYDTYGWRSGMVSVRGFHAIDDQPQAGVPERGETNHVAIA